MIQPKEIHQFFGFSIRKLGRYGDRWQEGDVICCQVLTLGAAPEVGEELLLDPSQTQDTEPPKSSEVAVFGWLVSMGGGA